MINIVLHEPGIALNTGNIGRTCVATESPLHLIRPYGFRINEKEIRRAGMDYWPKVMLSEYLDYEDFMKRNPGARVYYATTKAEQVYTEVRYEPDCFIMFGNESRGIPEEILVEHREDCIRRTMAQNGGTEKDIIKKIEKRDKYRSDYYKYHTGRDWNDARNYDFCLNTSSTSYEKLVKVVKDYISICTR